MNRIPAGDLERAFPKLSNIRELKAGGQKAVYQAYNEDFRDVVLKTVIREGTDPRIQREIDIVRNNAFPNVPSIYESGEFESGNRSFVYIIEQRVSGTDLRTELQGQSEVSLSSVLTFMGSLLNTLARLEEQNIVHRDIKPDNILHDADDNYWLIDFGIARDLDGTSLTATEANFGPHTAGYAAPEQFRNLKRQIDSRADLFSLGVVAYEMLHGENPFIAGANHVIDVYVKSESFTEDPLNIDGDVNSELSGFIQTLMQKNYTYRPPTAKIALSWFEEVAEELKGGMQQ